MIYVASFPILSYNNICSLSESSKNILHSGVGPQNFSKSYIAGDGNIFHQFHGVIERKTHNLIPIQKNLQQEMSGKSVIGWTKSK